MAFARRLHFDIGWTILSELMEFRAKLAFERRAGACLVPGGPEHYQRAELACTQVSPTPNACPAWIGCRESGELIPPTQMRVDPPAFRRSSSRFAWRLTAPRRWGWGRISSMPRG
jgi:hypothetical protein